MKFWKVNKLDIPLDSIRLITFKNFTLFFFFHSMVILFYIIVTIEALLSRNLLVLENRSVLFSCFWQPTRLPVYHLSKCYAKVNKLKIISRDSSWPLLRRQPVAFEWRRSFLFGQPIQKNTDHTLPVALPYQVVKKFDETKRYFSYTAQQQTRL